MNRHLSNERICEYIDGRLNGPDRAAVEAHLRTCSGCDAERTDLEATRTYLAQVPQEALPRSFYPRLDPAPAEPPPWWWGLLPRMQLATGAVAVLAILALGIESAGWGSPASPQAGLYYDAPSEMQSSEQAPSVPALRTAEDSAAPAPPAAPPGDADGRQAAGAAGAPPATAPSPSGPPVGPDHVGPPSPGGGVTEIVRPGPWSLLVGGLFVLIGGATAILSLKRRFERRG